MNKQKVQIKKGQVWQFKANDEDWEVKIKILKVEEEDRDFVEYTFGKKCLVHRRSVLRSDNIVEEDQKYITDFSLRTTYSLIPTKKGELILF